MPKVIDWKTRLSVKFVEYVNNGLGVLVGEYVGEAVRLGKFYFKGFCKIIDNHKELDDLPEITTEDRAKIKKTAEDLFGMQNFLKLLNE